MTHPASLLRVIDVISQRDSFIPVVSHNEPSQCPLFFMLYNLSSSPSSKKGGHCSIQDFWEGAVKFDSYSANYLYTSPLTHSHSSYSNPSVIGQITAHSQASDPHDSYIPQLAYNASQPDVEITLNNLVRRTHGAIVAYLTVPQFSRHLSIYTMSALTPTTLAISRLK
jgi:hypothetical protein